MRRQSYGYGAYRGRSRESTGLKVLVAILAVILILAVAGFFLAERYIVYGDDGEARLELPFLPQEKPEEKEDTPPAPVVPVVTPEPVSDEPERPEVILPVALSWEALWDGTAAESVIEAGGTAALFDMKPESGALGWVSDQELAIAAKVSLDDPEKNEAMKASAQEEDVYRIARISCFKDNELSNADLSLAIMTTSGQRWLDPDKIRWLSPASEKVQDYLTGACQELAELGFDEILLDNAGYPAKGLLSYIRKDDAYDAQRFETVITGFYQKVVEALKETGVALSVVYDPETTALSGQSEEAIKALGITVVTYDEDGVLTWQK